jgi:hypothetical protein
LVGRKEGGPLFVEAAVVGGCRGVTGTTLEGAASAKEFSFNSTCKKGGREGEQYRNRGLDRDGVKKKKRNEKERKKNERWPFMNKEERSCCEKERAGFDES